MRYSISDYIHCVIAEHLKGCHTVIDMGGKGKMKRKGYTVTNADIQYGIDATNLSFEDNSFDASVSIAVLEHVGDKDKQIQFINESIRVAKHQILHWIPIHKEVEVFLKSIGHDHKAIIPSLEVMDYLHKKFTVIDMITIREHLINLTMIYPKLSCKELYNYAYDHQDESYGVLMELIK